MKKQLANKKIFGYQSTGFAALFVTILVMAVVFGIAISISFLTYREQITIRNVVKSSEAYYAAESGIEDAIWRLAPGRSWSSPYSFSVEGAAVNVSISDILGGARTIVSEGNQNNRFRKVSTVYELSGATPGFFYGAQVGDGGLLMENSSKVVGNVFSNGNAELRGTAEITDTIRIASSGNKIFGTGQVSQDAYVDICEDVTIGGTLHANLVLGCSVSTVDPSGLPVDPIPLPITDEEIQGWKDEAFAGGTIGSFIRDSGTHSLGPVKIEGDLIIQNTAQLVITGAIWVTGKIDIKNSAKVYLDSSYGSQSGMIIGDGLITLQNSSVSSGSGTPGSYLMYISTSSANPAIIIKNFAKVDVLYSNTGWVLIENNADMRSVNAYGIHVQNSATLTYEIGLADSFFTSGPSAGWTVTNWREIE